MAILQWILERDDQAPVTTENIMAYARATVQKKFPDFQTSRGWVQEYMNRYSFSLCARTGLSQRLPDLKEKIASFYKFVKDLHLEGELKPKK